jgi:hypothetical protein
MKVTSFSEFEIMKVKSFSGIEFHMNKEIQTSAGSIHARKMAIQATGASRGRGIRRSPSPTGGGRYSLKSARCLASGGSMGCMTKLVANLTSVVSTAATAMTTQVIHVTTRVMRNEKTHIND